MHDLPLVEMINLAQWKHQIATICLDRWQRIFRVNKTLSIITVKRRASQCANYSSALARRCASPEKRQHICLVFTTWPFASNLNESLVGVLGARHASRRSVPNTINTFFLLLPLVREPFVIIDFNFCRTCAPLK